jgi:hypothetical protein
MTAGAAVAAITGAVSSLTLTGTKLALAALTGRACNHRSAKSRGLSRLEVGSGRQPAGRSSVQGCAAVIGEGRAQLKGRRRARGGSRVEASSGTRRLHAMIGLEAASTARRRRGDVSLAAEPSAVTASGP